MSTATIQEIPVEKITPSPFQARKSFDEEALKNLAQSMKSEGLIQPITVRLLDNDRYELIAGERRLRAAKLLGWPALDAVVQQGVADQDAAVKGVIENLQRVDLNPIERAQGYKHLEDMGLNQDVIAEKVGKDQPAVARTLALLSLPQEVQDFMSRDIISEGHIRYLGRIEDKDQFLHVAMQVVDQGWSVKETEKQVNKFLGKGPKADKEPATQKSPADLEWKGQKIAISRYFDPQMESVQDYLAWLTQALPVFAETRSPGSTAVTAASAVAADTTVAADTAVMADPAVTAAPTVSGAAVPPDPQAP
jgi:ParB family chromosome partitioning protein